MKRPLAILLFLLLLSACTPSQSTVQTAIAQTQVVWLMVLTLTPHPPSTSTPVPIETYGSPWTQTPIPFQTISPIPTVEFGNLSSPWPMDTLASIGPSVGSEMMDITLRILKVIRGQEAWTAIHNSNKFNPAPPAGMEPILIQLDLKNLSTTNNLSLDKYDFSIYSHGQLIDPFTYSPCCLQNAGYPEFDAELDPGAELIGWIASMARSGDNSPLLVLGADTNGSGGIYFLLTSP